MLLRPQLIITALFVGSLVLFLMLIPVPRVDGQLIGSDGVYYYTYVRSLVIDGDLDFTNEYTYFHLPLPPRELRPTAHVPNKYALGPALLWLPFFLVAHLLALSANRLGLPVTADGYSYLYQSAVSIGSIVYGTLGFVLAVTCAQHRFSRAAVLWAVVVLWLASNAFYYMVFEPSMAHMVSLFSVSALLTVWYTRFRQPTPPALRATILLGLTAGVVPLVRLQDVVFVAVPAGWVIAQTIRATSAGQYPCALRWGGHALLAGTIALLVFSPQLATWQYLYGTWSTSPYVAERSRAFIWLTPQIGSVLFSSFHGLFTWHPIYLIALGGLILIARTERWVALALLLAMGLNSYIVAAWWAWWQGDSFGGRMFLNATWVWLFGLMAVGQWLWIQRQRWVAIGVGLLLMIWNALSLAQLRLGFVPMSAPLTWEQMTIERLMLPWRLVQRILL